MLESIFHQPYGSFAFPIDFHTIRIRLKIKKGTNVQISVSYGDRYRSPLEDKIVKLAKIGFDELFDYYQGDLICQTRRVRYTFFFDFVHQAYWYGDKGIARDRLLAGDFQYAYINEKDQYIIPEWVKEGIVYQIFPERFFNGDKTNDPVKVEKWGGKPKTDNFFGGDLAGVREKLPYLADLGINVIYFTPLFASPSNHKYDTTDYYQIDPHFGDLETLKRLVNEAHRLGIKIILDAVFNHAGYQFFAFQDVLEKGENSVYKDWFYIDSFPVITQPHPNYETFANEVWTMPKLKTSNPAVRDYLLGVVSYWTKEAGIDGWRLDVANEVDHDFWRAFRQTVKGINPDAIIIGEVWHDAEPWLEGDQYDGVMNYLFRDAVYEFIGKRTIGATTFVSRLNKARMKYRDQANFSMFNLIDSHDTERFLTTVDEKVSRLKLAALIQFTYLGMPMLYYGDEIGMTGNNDPDCRKTFEWNEKKQDKELKKYYQKLAAIRKEEKSLTHGDFQLVAVDELKQVVIYKRVYQEEEIYIVINNSLTEQTITIPVASTTKLQDLLNGTTYLAIDNNFVINIPKESGTILKI